MLCGNPFERGGIFGHTVTFQRWRAAVEKERFAVMAGQSQKRQHHVFVIALQENIFRRASAEFKKNFDDITRGRPAIDIVAYEHDRVSAYRGDCAEHRRKFVNAAMNIADREQPSATRATSPAFDGTRPNCENLLRQRSLLLLDAVVNVSQ
jgi:hypothetical protein